jgi:hypothetical protein
MMEGACNIVKGTQQSSAEEICFPTVSKGRLDRLIRVYRYVMATAYKWRKKTGAQGPLIINPAEDRSRRMGYPSDEWRRE